jgi:hypothetical protein
MKFKLTRHGAAILGCAAAFVLSTAVASADPPDPHQPDMTKGYCPGGRWGYGSLAVCDGDKYPDGSFWHQWMKTWIAGPSSTTTASAATNLSRARRHLAAAPGRPRPQPDLGGSGMAVGPAHGARHRQSRRPGGQSQTQAPITE